MVSAYKPLELPLLPKELDSIFNHGEAIILCGDLSCKGPSWNGKIGTLKKRFTYSLSYRSGTHYNKRVL
jgi:hypothetical protein